MYIFKRNKSLCKNVFAEKTILLSCKNNQWKEFTSCFILAIARSSGLKYDLMQDDKMEV